ncbi:MAG: hypothetical protein QXU82_00085 [Candidatus Aenigmatarchaeota archaeon]
MAKYQVNMRGKDLEGSIDTIVSRLRRRLPDKGYKADVRKNRDGSIAIDTEAPYAAVDEAMGTIRQNMVGPRGMWMTYNISELDENGVKKEEEGEESARHEKEIESIARTYNIILQKKDEEITQLNEAKRALVSIKEQKDQQIADLQEEHRKKIAEQEEKYNKLKRDYEALSKMIEGIGKKEACTTEACLRELEEYSLALESADVKMDNVDLGTALEAAKMSLDDWLKTNGADNAPEQELVKWTDSEYCKTALANYEKARAENAYILKARSGEAGIPPSLLEILEKSADFEGNRALIEEFEAKKAEYDAKAELHEKAKKLRRAHAKGAELKKALESISREVPLYLEMRAGMACTLTLPVMQTEEHGAIASAIIESVSQTGKGNRMKNNEMLAFDLGQNPEGFDIIGIKKEIDDKLGRGFGLKARLFVNYC